jgi:hypothetical protein
MIAPDTVQTVSVNEAKLTGNPEDAVAINVTVDPTLWAAGAVNDNVWLAWLTVTESVLLLDAPLLASPLYAAVSV